MAVNQLFNNNAFSALAAPVTSVGQTTLSLTNGTGVRFPSPSNGEFFQLTLIGLDGSGNENAWEVVNVSTRTTDSCTVVRGRDGTAAAASWPQGTRVELRDTASSKTDPKVVSLTVNGNAQSGTNTGDQTITLTGDVTGGGTGSFAATIAAGAVTLAKMAVTATATFLGRNSAGTGNVEALSVATVKTLLGVSNVDNTSDANKPVSTAQAAADTATLNSAKIYADGLVVGLWDDRGGYDASVNTFPAAGGSGTAGAILKGDIWTVSVAGTLGGVPIAARQTVRATVDAPGQTAGNWAIGMANTDVEDAIASGVTGRAPSQNAVYAALAAKASLTGAETLTNKRISALYVVDKTVTNAAASGAVSMDTTTASAFEFTLAGDTTLSISAAPTLSGETLSFVVRITCGATARNVTWFAGITWLTLGNVAPAAPAANKTVEYVFTSTTANQYFGRKGAAT